MSMIDLSSSGVRVLNFSSGITDDQWTELKGLVSPPLPEDARDSVEIIIGFFQWLADKSTIQETRQSKLKLARKRERKCLKTLAGIIFGAAAEQDPKSSVLPEQITKTRRPLEQACKALEQRLKCYEKDLASMPSKKRGTRTGSERLLALVALLNGLIVECTGKPIARSNNKNRVGEDFVRALYRIANEQLKPSTTKKTKTKEPKEPSVTGAIRQVITEYRDDGLIGIDVPDDTARPIHNTGKKARSFELNIRANGSRIPYLFTPRPGLTEIKIRKLEEPGMYRVSGKVSSLAK